MRQFCTTLALALLVSFTVSVDAEAKKEKKPKKGDEVTTEQPADAAAAEPMALEIAATGIADVDNVFNAAVEPLKTLAEVRGKLDSLNTNLTTALGLPAGTPFKDAIADLAAKAEGKINVAISEQGMPKLEPGDAVPENVQNAINAVNGGVSDVMSGVEALKELPAQFQQIAANAAAINPKSLISSGVKPTEAPKVMKSITGNIKVVGSAPDQLKALTDSVMELKNSLTSSFSGANAEGATPAPTE